MPRYTGHAGEHWGSFVDVKINVPERLADELERGVKGTVWLSSVTDPYQPIERKYLLTRRCLELLAQYDINVIVQTKSSLVLRDVDVFLDLKDVEVGLTLTTPCRTTAKLFEPRAPTPQKRVKTLKALHDAGIRTFAFIGPLLPGEPKKLAEMLVECVDYVLIDKMNYRKSIEGFYEKHGLLNALQSEFFEHQKHILVEAMNACGVNIRVLF
jgi:DNA repair photolyase